MRNIVNALLLRGNTILLARRALGRRAYAGLWSFPGGHVEKGETLERALIRELTEEVGVTPVAYSEVGRISDPNRAGSDPVTYYMYAVTVWRGGEPAIIDEEHTELEWFALETAIALPDLALEEYRPLLAKLAGRF